MQTTATNWRHDLALALDPARLFAAATGSVPDSWQAELLRSNAARVLLNCSRQTGKSTVAAAIALHQALYEPRALVLLLSPSLRQSQELFKKCVACYRALGRPVAPHVESQLQLELTNGSRIVSLPGNEVTIRGFSGVRLLVIDEAARVQDTLYTSVRPMLAVSGGRLIALSTPFGKRGWWYEAWAHGGETWQRYEVPATECPRISPAFLAEERQALGDWWFSQEYLCQFVDTNDQIFASADIEAAVGLGGVAPLVW